MAVVVGYRYWPYYLSFAGYPTSCDIVSRHLLTARFRRQGNGKPSSARPNPVRPRFLNYWRQQWRALFSSRCVRQCIKHIEPRRKHLQIRPNNPVSYTDVLNGISGTLSSIWLDMTMSAKCFSRITEGLGIRTHIGSTHSVHRFRKLLY
jgi:hypothetical protein